MMDKKNCICCGKQLDISFGMSLYCSECSLHNNKRSMELGALKIKYEKLESKYFKLKHSILKKELKKNE